MKKYIKLFMLAAAVSLTACSNDDDNDFLTIKHDGVQVTLKNIDKWVAAAQAVAARLQGEADSMLQQWLQQEAETFVKQGNVGEIIQGCAITAKMAPRVTEWFSDAVYRDYILSIRNSYYGSMDGTPAEASLASLTAALNPALDTQIRTEITAAETDPSAALALAGIFAEKLAPLYASLKGYDEQLMAVRATYVQAVALPTLQEAKTNWALSAAIVAGPLSKFFEGQI